MSKSFFISSALMLLLFFAPVVAFGANASGAATGLPATSAAGRPSNPGAGAMGSSSGLPSGSVNNNANGVPESSGAGAMGDASGMPSGPVQTNPSDSNIGGAANLGSSTPSSGNQSISP